MATLHLLRTSAFSDNNFPQCIDTLVSGDAIVLLDDGCYNLNHHLLQQCYDDTIPMMVIEEHAEARGLTLEPICKPISMTDLVANITLFDTVMTWQ